MQQSPLKQTAPSQRYFQQQGMMASMGIGGLPVGSINAIDQRMPMLSDMKNAMAPGMPFLPRDTWRNPKVPSAALNEANVIFYFCDKENDFYNSTSDNEVWLMQNQQQRHAQAMQEGLLTMRGEQYELIDVRAPPLFVIRKHRRTANGIQPLSYYYVLDGVVSQAPDLYSVIETRLSTSMAPLKEAMLSAMKNLRFNPSQGYRWEFMKKPVMGSVSKAINDSDSDDELNPMNVRTTPYQRQRTDALLKVLMEQFPLKHCEEQAKSET